MVPSSVISYPTTRRRKDNYHLQFKRSRCEIDILVPLQVTWIRHRDVHVLTVGEYTYTTDERFTARHNRATDEWVLVIKYVQERDAGVYECQIPTATSKSYPVQLNIVGESRASLKSETI